MGEATKTKRHFISNQIFTKPIGAPESNMKNSPAS